MVHQEMVKKPSPEGENGSEISNQEMVKKPSPEGENGSKISNQEIADLFNEGQKVIYLVHGEVQVASSFKELILQAEERNANKG